MILEAATTATPAEDVASLVTILATASTRFSWRVRSQSLRRLPRRPAHLVIEDVHVLLGQLHHHRVKKLVPSPSRGFRRRLGA
jgi:hypothetical protein